MLCACVVSGTADARTALLRTNDGNLFRGELIDRNNDVVVISVQGINATFLQENVLSVELLDDPQTMYQKQRRTLAATDLAGRLDLVDRLIIRDALRLAKFELTDLERDFPEHPAVVEQAAIVDAKMRLLETRQNEAAVRRAASSQRLVRRGETVNDRFLSRDHIDLIKVYEVDLAEQPRVVVSDDTIDSFFQRYGHRMDGSDRRARLEFRRLEGYEQLERLFDLQARDLYEQVEIKREPGPLSKFRRSVNPHYVARYFAPIFGHGEIEGLWLFNQRPEDEAEAYTNFYRLTQFTYDGLPMIDRADPELSLLLQWGLARESARFPAPDIPGWEPEFRSTDDSDFQRYVDWIDSLFKDDLDYGISASLND